MAKIKFGWSEVNLVPEGAKVDLAGQFYERISDQVESVLTVTAWAVDSGDDAAIFCGCDLVSTSEYLLKEVRERLAVRPDVPADKVMISAIHTHTAPGYEKRSDMFSGLSTMEILKTLEPEAEYVSLVSDTEGMFIGQEAPKQSTIMISKISAIINLLKF